MKRKTILTLGAAATAAVIGAIAIPAIAAGPDGWGPSRMMQMMHGQQGDFMPGFGGPGMMMQRGDHGARNMGPMGMGGMTDNPVYQSFDADGDGTVSASELEAGLAAQLNEHDADGNGALSSDEFASLFAQMTRGMAERPFAMLDADQNGEISADEMAFPAQMMARMRLMHVNDAAPAGE
ncbi:MAG: hypothetical protein A2092_05160 [Rhodobacteraceae bacterium GWE1_64_9]|nr:MAG: hypothetical protein A2092_05160 [Rhodobacteraceae bacterium GWE1_64_9]